MSCSIMSTHMYYFLSKEAVHVCIFLSQEAVTYFSRPIKAVTCMCIQYAFKALGCFCHYFVMLCEFGLLGVWRVD